MQESSSADSPWAAHRDYLAFVQLDDAPFMIGELFQRKFGCACPPKSHRYHQVALYKDANNQFIPLGYLTFTPWKNVILVGGGMTDGKAFQHVEPAHSEALRESGGILFIGLRYGFNYYAESCSAFFGHVGDKRAYEVDINAGFRDTGHPNLVVNFHRKLSGIQRYLLTRRVKNLGPF